MLDHSAQSGSHPLEERGNDCYSTPAVAIDALLTVKSLPYRIWEPAAGHGNIVSALRAAGHKVIASDIIRYTFPLDFEADFLAQKQAPAGTELVLTNPPYRLATEFVDHALTLCPHVVMLCRLAFLESERRSGILDQRPFFDIARWIKLGDDKAIGGPTGPAQPAIAAPSAPPDKPWPRVDEPTLNEVMGDELPDFDRK